MSERRKKPFRRSKQLEQLRTEARSAIQSMRATAKELHEHAAKTPMANGAKVALDQAAARLETAARQLQIEIDGGSFELLRTAVRYTAIAVVWLGGGLRDAVGDDIWDEIRPAVAQTEESAKMLGEAFGAYERAADDDHDDGDSSDRDDALSAVDAVEPEDDLQTAVNSQMDALQLDNNDLDVGSYLRARATSSC